MNSWNHVAGKYRSPGPNEDLLEGIKTVTDWIKQGGWHATTEANMNQWLLEANKILAAQSAGGFAGYTSANIPGNLFGLKRQPKAGDIMTLDGWKPALADAAMSNAKLPPMNCTRCNFRNEYVGREHLRPDGTYTCRTCKGST